MYRCECECKKYNATRKRHLKSWSRIHCKICKSRNRVYYDDVLVYDYNLKSPKFQKAAIVPANPIDIIKNLVIPIRPKKNPIKNDVFFGITQEFELMILDELNELNEMNEYNVKNLEDDSGDSIMLNDDYEELFNKYINY
jgi:hypothetical protein